jgi:putative ABC transport system substrate-binding protein
MRNSGGPRFPAAVLALAFALTLALTLSTGAFAQSHRVYRIGVLEVAPASANRANMSALLKGLKERGYVEGQNLDIDYRSSDGRSHRFAELAAGLVRAKPDVIVTRSTAAALAVKFAGAIPVVMTSSSDPVDAGLAATLARPGGTVTGLTIARSELRPKRLEILKNLVPGLSRIGVPLDMSNPRAQGQWTELERAAQRLGLQAVLFDARDAAGLNGAFRKAGPQGIGAFVVIGETDQDVERIRTVIKLAREYRLPVIYSAGEAVQAGGLLSYGIHHADLYYRSASYVDRILQGARPGDLPIEQPTQFELIINLMAAKAIGLTVPRELVLRADKVIE